MTPMRAASRLVEHSLTSMCVHSACLAPWITFEEWTRNDGCCDPCAAMRPSDFNRTVRSNDIVQQEAVREADARWEQATAAEAPLS